MTDHTLDWELPRVQRTAGSPAWVRNALLAITLVLVVFGLLSVYSASSFAARQSGRPGNYVLLSQLARAAVGVVALIVAAFVDYRVYERLAWPILAVVAALLLVLILPGTTEIAPVRNGSRRWLELGPVTFQPSELAKVAVVVWTAALAVRKQEAFDRFRGGVLPFLLILGPVLVLIAAEPHLSATLITGGLLATVLFAAGMRIRHFLLLALPVVPALWWLVRSNSYQLARILAFLDPGKDTSGIGYQLQQAEIAIGSGGVTGAGYGESTQKLHYLPEAQNDFIYPIIAEEWGFVGAVAVLALFLVWTHLGLRIAQSAPDLFGRLIAIGLTAIVAIGAFGHIGVTLGLLPTTGVSLPFISAGGTGLVTALGITGVLLNVASRRRR
ncbi:FtsW/RodA/SpoVE family cell cycle protein [Candidatus Palauibacter sp.]|uniref:FtsW/RodA/SpoVE family cell cycle protein n=1 Tax=Candidatus Palauibacter sp. TaxID=3101350 RepID=UPI003C6F131A